MKGFQQEASIELTINCISSTMMSCDSFSYKHSPKILSELLNIVDAGSRLQSKAAGKSFLNLLCVILPQIG